VVDASNWELALSFGQAWIPACIVSGLWCTVRASRQGHSRAQYFALGLLLGPGAIPVVRLATREDFKSLTGTGLSRAVPAPEKSQQQHLWGELSRRQRELRLGLVVGVGGGLLLNLSQAMTHFLPEVFATDHRLRYSEASSQVDWEWALRAIWIFLALVGPTLAYLAMESWRPADRDPIDPEVLQRGFETQILDWSPRFIPLLLVLFFVLVLAGCTVGAVVLQKLCR